MQTPKISIITITYNSERTLEETILSVINQHYNNLEYIIIDGGSKDKTLQIVDKYKDRISLVISEPDKGISDAFNKGINHATGDIVGIINSDDLLEEGALEILCREYDEHVDVYRGYTYVLWDDETNHKTTRKPITKFTRYTSYFVNHLLKRDVCHQSTFIKLSAYKKYGLYSLEYKYMMDRDLLTRFYYAGATFKFIDVAYATSRIGGVTTQTSPTKKIKEIKNVYIQNGGSKILSWLRVLEFCAYQFIAKLYRKL